MKTAAWFIAAFVLIFAVLIVSLGITGIQHENDCWAFGFDEPLYYMGRVYCFGRNGEPEVVSLSDLQEPFITEAARR
jgi:hypothetical protein